MYRVVKEIVEGPSRKLLESVAESIAEAILDGFDVESVTVTVKKPEVPIKGSILSTPPWRSPRSVGQPKSTIHGVTSYCTSATLRSPARM